VVSVIRMLQHNILLHYSASPNRTHSLLSPTPYPFSLEYRAGPDISTSFPCQRDGCAGKHIYATYPSRRRLVDGKLS
jgi:hypothetical protein